MFVIVGYTPEGRRLGYPRKRRDYSLYTEDIAQTFECDSIAEADFIARGIDYLKRYRISERFSKAERERFKEAA